MTGPVAISVAAHRVASGGERNRSGPVHLRGDEYGLPLTAREWQVVAVMGRTDTVQDIATALDCTLMTAKSHVHRICTKLGVTSQKGILRAVGYLRVPSDVEIEARWTRDRLLADLVGLVANTPGLIERLRGAA